MNTRQATMLVAAREIRVKLRDRTFLISTLIFLLIAAGATILPGLLSGGPASVAVGGDTGQAAAVLTEAGLDVRVVADDAAAEQAVRAGEVDAAVITGPTVLALDTAPTEVVGALSAAPPVVLLDPDAVDPFLAFAVPFVFAFVFFITSQTFGLQIAQSITEEKQTRIVEILAAAVPIRALLAGKVLAGCLLALGQIVLIALVTLAGLQFSGNTDVLTLVGPAIGWFVPFFLLGFLLLAAMWAVAGAVVSRQEDIAASSTPVQLALMLPFFAVVFFNDNVTVLRALSYLPFSSPMAMPLRAFTGDMALWEALLSLVLLAVTAVAFVAAGARIYQGSLLRTGGRVALATAWRSRETTG
ncbi:ABC transporter permease [Micromonospora rosaria]|uniref:ABC transporter permease n=1 Tax=Micromonospora rosaria TaxID=47874 RepID=A0A136PTI7_9ACTN|nr:ABC transporter permease [Micromonospora rosaria]KXK61466.1 ABC transporter permease [Micromonospora rosaria]